MEQIDFVVASSIGGGIVLAFIGIRCLGVFCQAISKRRRHMQRQEALRQYTHNYTVENQTNQRYFGTTGMSRRDFFAV